MTTHAEAEIVQGCIDGDRYFQELLYRAHADKMYSVCLTYVDDEDDAGDILHDGFLKVFRSISTYSGSGSLEGWIRRIIVNTALEALRKKKRQLALIEDAHYEREEHSESILDRIAATDIIKLVNALPMKAGLVLKLYSIEAIRTKKLQHCWKSTRVLRNRN